MFRRPVDVVFEKDVAVTMHDGLTIYVDVLRLAGAERAPVLVAWSPYGKSQGSSPGTVPDAKVETLIRDLASDNPDGAPQSSGPGAIRTLCLILAEGF